VSEVFVTIIDVVLVAIPWVRAASRPNFYGLDLGLGPGTFGLGLEGQSQGEAKPGLRPGFDSYNDIFSITLKLTARQLHCTAKVKS